MSEVDRFVTGKSPKCLRLSPLVSYPRLRSDGALQTTHDIWGYWWGVRVCRHFGARGRSSVRYGTRLGDLEESWLMFSN